MAMLKFKVDPMRKLKNNIDDLQSIEAELDD